MKYIDDYDLELVKFGGGIADYNENNVLFPDLHTSNVGVFPEDHPDAGMIVVYDHDDICTEEFPGDLDVHASSLYTFLSEISSEALSAFKFGYILQTGPTGEEIFLNLRQNYGINSFKDTGDTKYNFRQDDFSEVSKNSFSIIHEKWKKERERAPFSSLYWKEYLLHGMWPLKPLNGDYAGKKSPTAAFFSEGKNNQNAPKLAEYSYKIAFYYSIVEKAYDSAALALINLAAINFRNKKMGAFYAAGLTYTALGMLSSVKTIENFELKTNVEELGMRNMPAYLNSLTKEQYRHLEFVPYIENPFLCLSCLDDLSCGDISGNPPMSAIFLKNIEQVFS